MTPIESVLLDVPDPTVANAFYDAAEARQEGVLGLRRRLGCPGRDDLAVQVRRPVPPDQGVPAVGRHDTVRSVQDSLTHRLLASPPMATNWPVGEISSCATAGSSSTGCSLLASRTRRVAPSTQEDIGPATRQADQIMLLLGEADVAASKRFYVERSLAVERSFGRKYVEFPTPSTPVKLALLGRRALVKDAGVSSGGSGSHQTVIRRDAGPFTGPDGSGWEAA